MRILSPSLLSADFWRTGEQLKELEDAGVKWLHLDVMDGHMVPNISFGVPVIKALRGKCKLLFDTHLMISHPKQYAKAFADAGSDHLTFHLESDDDVSETISAIRNCGCTVGISIKPGTPAEAVYPYLEQVDMVLVMTVEPGHGGQKLIPETIEKVRKVKAEIEKRGLDVEIQVDGGINADNAGELVSAGASILVAGSSVFKHKDRRAAIEALRANG